MAIWIMCFSIDFYMTHALCICPCLFTCMKIASLWFSEILTNSDNLSYCRATLVPTSATRRKRLWISHPTTSRQGRLGRQNIDRYIASSHCSHSDRWNAFRSFWGANSGGKNALEARQSCSWMSIDYITMQFLRANFLTLFAAVECLVSSKKISFVVCMDLELKFKCQ